ncbi:hypothetical protein I4U23_026253 [Adineta vaga]|nr:hypothetical protein I4U23_026253 [Adineta vaga]
MSSKNEINRNRDPRQRDRSRSELRRTDDNTPTVSSPIPTNQNQSITNNNVVDFFKTLGLNSQLIQALINANPPKIEQIPLQQPSVNNAQEFASFLSSSYGLDSMINPSTNRDPRRQQLPPVATSNSPECDQSIQTSISIDESYKQYLTAINQSLLDDETRKRFQRITLLETELVKLHRMNIELTKTSTRHSRRRSSTKDKDPLLKENEILQTELLDYIKSLKTTTMINYPIYLLNNQTIFRR